MAIFQTTQPTFDMCNEDGTSAFESMCRRLFTAEFWGGVMPHSNHNTPGIGKMLLIWLAIYLRIPLLRQEGVMPREILFKTPAYLWYLTGVLVAYSNAILSTFFPKTN